MPENYTRMFKFISWLRHIIRTPVSRPYTSVLFDFLRLIRRWWQVAVGRKERLCQEQGSSQPTEQDKLTTSATLAVPPLQTPLHHEGCQPATNVRVQTTEIDEGPHALWIRAQNPQRPPVPEQSPGITLTPITPSQIRRNDRSTKIQDEYVVFEVAKGPLDCSEDLALVAGWEPLTHPSGALFFYQPYKRVFTDVDVRDPETAAKMCKTAEKAYEGAWNADIAMLPSVELALELMSGDSNTIDYYFVDHDRRIIFWFEAHKSIHLMLDVRGVERKSHVTNTGPYTSEPFWTFPDFHGMASTGGMSIYFQTNAVFRKMSLSDSENSLYTHRQAKYIDLGTSLSPFASDQVESMLGLMDPLMSSLNKEHGHSVRIVGGSMHGTIFIVNFLNFYGQPNARRNTNKLRYEYSDKRSNTILSRIMNLVMFGSPNAHRKVLHWILAQQREEWSTVLLAVDISFLAVPFVQTRTSAILVSYLSTLCAMGSFVVTLVFATQLNDGRRYPAERVASFMFGMKSSIERLALMLSLPFAFSIWGAIPFTASLSIVIFRTSDIVTVSIACPIWAAIVILATWPAPAGHIGTPNHWIMQRTIRLTRWTLPI
ncbi:hypothetical protein EDD22DRAFT_970954 [Suillus occidentalis]|nr:hypothetical protein EDD22DRAFT_970954 [Suillus occidentalis]